MNLDEILTATRDVAPLDVIALERGHSTTLTAVHDDLAHRARIARRRARRRAISAAAVLATASAVSVFVSVGGNDAAPEGGLTAAPAVVQAPFTNASQIVNAARTAAGKGSDELGDAPYWKVVSEYTESGIQGSQEITAGTRTIWQGITGPGVLRDTTGGSFKVAGGGILELPQATLRLGSRIYTWREVNAGALTTAQIHDLLTLADDATSSLDGRPASEWYIVKQARELLSETPAAPAVRQAIWQELSTMSGVTTSGRTIDAAGREGWNLTYTVKDHGSQRLIVDPATGAILQAEVESQESTYRVTYLHTGPSDSAPTPTAETRMPAGPRVGTPRTE